MSKHKKSKLSTSDPSLKDAIKTTKFWDDYFRRLVAEAESGKHPESARELIFEFVSCLDSHELPRSQVTGYIHKALGEIWAGKDPSVALNLVKPAHRPAGKRDDQQLKLAVEYHLRVRAGVTKNLAKDQVGLTFGASAKAVERAVKEYNLLPGYSDSELDGIRQSWSSVPKKGR